MTAAQFVLAPWEGLGRAEKQTFLDAYCLEAPVFGGRTLASFISAKYGFDTARVLSLTKLRLLDSAEFAAEVKRLAWNGPIYFRGITAPDPDDPNRYVILFDEGLMKKMSSFDRPLYRMLEYALIAIHELNHVHQDLAGKARGLDLSIRSAEALVLVKGMAESYAESAALEAGRAAGPLDPLPLFVSEHGEDAVSREGNAQSGDSFP